MIAPSVGYVSAEQMSNEIERAIRKLGPEVVKVRYTIGPDYDGDPSIEFRIVLADEASQEKKSGRGVSLNCKNSSRRASSERKLGDASLRHDPKPIGGS
jgi:hypothetical protein